MENSFKTLSGDKESRRTYPKVTSLPYRFRSLYNKSHAIVITCPLNSFHPPVTHEMAVNSTKVFRSWNNSSRSFCSTLKQANYKSGA